MTPTPTPGFNGALVLLGGALAIAFAGAALNAGQAREEPRGGDGDGDGNGDNGTRNETPRRPPLRPAPPPRAIERQNPHEGLRDLEDARGGGGGGGEGRKDMMILMVVLAMQVIITVMMMLQIGSETNITALLELSISVGIILFVWFSICRGLR